MDFWEKEVISRLDQGTDISKLKPILEKKLNSGCYFPEKYRGMLWSKLVRNHCGITEDLFLLLMKESKDFELNWPKETKAINVDI
jgi:hypothetical protein